MMRQVRFYESPEALKASDFQSLLNNVVITATASMVDAIREQCRVTHRNLFCIHDIQKKIVGSWDSPKTILTQLYALNTVIKEIEVTTAYRSFLESFTKNRYAILNSIRLLVEADCYPDDIEPNSDVEELFKEIWCSLEANESSFGKFRARLALFDADISYFRNALSKLSPEIDQKEIVFQGFYFITPIQERIFHWIEKIVPSVVFIGLSNKNHSPVYSLWGKTLNQECHFVKEDTWQYDDSFKLPLEHFSNCFLNSISTASFKHVRTIEYLTELDFISDIRRLFKNQFHIYSMDNKTTDKYIKEYYPDKSIRRHFLSYPIGQFLYRLHTMWDNHDQKLKLSFEDLKVCLASGWLQDNLGNARELLGDLEKIRTYFKDCQSFDDWQERLSYLMKVKSQIVDRFKQELAGISVNEYKMHTVLGEPLLNFSCFNVDIDRLHRLSQFLEELISLAKRLFNHPGHIYISKHLETLKDIIESRTNEEGLSEDEVFLLQELYKNLVSKDLEDVKCLPSDLLDAIMMIVGGEDILQSKLYDTDYDRTEVLPLSQIEALLLMAPETRVHLCFADETHLPGKIKNYPWPLTKTMVQRMGEKINTHRRVFLNRLIQIFEISPLVNRYLFNCLIQLKEVELSWVKMRNTETIAASPYVNMLQSLWQCSHQTVGGVADVVLSEEMFSDCIDDFCLDISDKNLEQQLDACWCPWRYWYGHVLNDRPMYYSSFHYNFAISSLIAVIQGLVGGDKRSVSKHVLELFPYIKAIEAEQIVDFVPTYSISERKRRGDYLYPATALYIHFLKQDDYSKANEKFEELEGKVILDFDKGPIDCKLCPCSDSCQHKHN